MCTVCVCLSWHDWLAPSVFCAAVVVVVVVLVLAPLRAPANLLLRPVPYQGAGQVRHTAAAAAHGRPAKD